MLDTFITLGIATSKWKSSTSAARQVPAHSMPNKKNSKTFKQFCLIENQRQSVFYDPHSKRKHGFLYSAHTYPFRSSLETGRKNHLRNKYIWSWNSLAICDECGWYYTIDSPSAERHQIFPLIDGIQNLCRYVRYLQALVKINETNFFFSSIFVWNAKTQSDSISISIERLQKLRFVCVFFVIVVFFISSPFIKVMVLFSVCDGKFMKNAIKIVPFRSVQFVDGGLNRRSQNRNDFNWNERTPKVKKKRLQTKMYGLINHLTKNLIREKKSDRWRAIIVEMICIVLWLFCTKS